VDVVVWVHGDNLNEDNPALRAYAGAPALFVWDEALLEAWAISLKRVVFIYECLLALPVAIRRGDVADEVARFAAAHGAGTVAAAGSPSPRFAEICAGLRARGLSVEIWDEAPFVELRREPDLRRFSRYWRDARRALGL
jgi:hypothetical protein